MEENILIDNEQEIPTVDEILNTSTVENTSESIVVEFPNRPFLETPLNQYSVTEGLLLISLMFALFTFLTRRY